MRPSAFIRSSIFALVVLFFGLGNSYDADVKRLFEQGNEALAAGGASLPSAISSYKTALTMLLNEIGDPELIPTEDLEMILSLYINLGTAYSSIPSADNDMLDRAIESYREAIKVHEDYAYKRNEKDLNDLAAQSAFFLGMEYQDSMQFRFAADAYALAGTLDPYHWAAMGNLGSVLQDHLKELGDAIVAYNRAFDIITKDYMVATDMPEYPAPILSQLQYRIGLAINASPKHKCAITDDPERQRDCKELAANAFSLATRYDPNNEEAKHMLATVTADATMKRASNKYVTALFDDYAQNFEHSLVEELRYNGYERLRRGFDRAFGGGENVPQFSMVVDAGCGTGLVGEQFRNVSQHLLGVDLSEAIINEAKKARPGLYDSVEVGDVTEIFRKVKPISLIIAGDSYIYFGDLSELFISMKEGLMEGGFAAFTLENVQKDTEAALATSKPEWRWQLTASGRFAHRKDYVESVARQHALKVVHYEELNNFRYEGGQGVRGHIFVVKKDSTEEL